MKRSSNPLLCKLAAMLLGLAIPGIADGGTFNWGNSVLDTLCDSYGRSLDDTYYFQLGFFEDSFVPTEENVADWKLNWVVFDQAEFEPELGYFTSTVQLNADGSSSSPDAAAVMNFPGQVAYLWVRNSDDPGPETEWFLARSEDWVLPAAESDCCDNSLPVEWSLSDLAPSNTPVWGNQGGTMGAGSYTVTDHSYTLQTFTVVPEPSCALLALAWGFIVLLRRRPETRRS